MAVLRQLDGQHSYVLQPEHLIGRGHQCATQLAPKYVSAQHALIRWNGSGWELIDRGSRNGTLLNGERLEPRRAYVLEAGALIAFGDERERWTLVDATEPRAAVACVELGVTLSEEHGFIAIPCAEDPQATAFRDNEGVWRLEPRDGAVLVLRNGDSFELASTRWTFYCPDITGETAAVENPRERPEPTARFSVSSDEEFVELALDYAGRAVTLGARAHNYLLLVLARARLADAGGELPEASRGWIYKDELAVNLRMTPQQIDGEVFRIRRHVARLGVEDAALIVERRPRTKQLRFGLSRIAIQSS